VPTINEHYISYNKYAKSGRRVLLIHPKVINLIHKGKAKDNECSVNSAATIMHIFVVVNI
jgi:hypothetical protein